MDRLKWVAAGALVAALLVGGNLFVYLNGEHTSSEQGKIERRVIRIEDRTCFDAPRACLDRLLDVATPRQRRALRAELRRARRRRILRAHEPRRRAQPSRPGPARRTFRPAPPAHRPPRYRRPTSVRPAPQRPRRPSPPRPRPTVPRPPAPKPPGPRLPPLPKLPPLLCHLATAACR